MKNPCMKVFLLEVTVCTERRQQYLSFVASQALLQLGRHIPSNEKVGKKK